MVVLPRSSDASTSSDALLPSVPERQRLKLPVGGIAGIVVGVVLVVLLLGAGILLFRRTRQAIASRETVFSAGRTQFKFNFKKILGIDQGTILRDLSAYLAGQLSHPTVAPVIVRNSILRQSGSEVSPYSRGRGNPRIYVNPRDVELGPNPVIEAHIVQALKDQGQTLSSFNSPTSQRPVKELHLAHAAPLSWQADRVQKSGDLFSSGRKIKSPKRKITHVRVDDSDVLSIIEEEDTDLPPLSDPENPYPPSSIRCDGGLNSNICDTTPENNSTHLMSTEITPRSSSSTPASSSLTNSCSCPMAPEEVQDDSEPQSDQPLVDGVVENLPVAVFPVHVEFTDPVLQVLGSLPSAPKSVDDSSPASTGAEVACEPSSSLDLILTPTATTSTGSNDNVIDLPFACPDCPLKFGTAGQRRTHYNRKHNRRYTCKICSASFNLGPDLLRHQQNVHRKMFPSEAKTFQCTNAWCATPNKPFGRKDNFLRHQRQCRPTTAKAKSKSANSDVGLT